MCQTTERPDSIVGVNIISSIMLVALFPELFLTFKAGLLRLRSASSLIHMCSTWPLSNLQCRCTLSPYSVCTRYYRVLDIFMQRSCNTSPSGYFFLARVCGAPHGSSRTASIYSAPTLQLCKLGLVCHMLSFAPSHGERQPALRHPHTCRSPHTARLV